MVFVVLAMATLHVYSDQTGWYTMVLWMVDTLLKLRSYSAKTT